MKKLNQSCKLQLQMCTKHQYENIQKIKLHRYIIYMQWWAQKVNKDKILMQKHTPRETTNATNVHHQQYSSYNDTPNMNAKHKNQNHFYFR